MSAAAVSVAQLQERLSWPLERKVEETHHRLEQYFGRWRQERSGIYLAFSGGKDSTVLLDLIRTNPFLSKEDIPAVFSDTGLEYPEVREFALARAQVVVRPEMNFRQVLTEYGFPVASKIIAKSLRHLQSPCNKNAKVRHLALTGITSAGRSAPQYKIPKRWLSLINAPFRVSEKCCDITKKRPLARYERESNRAPMTASMVGESRTRGAMYLRYGCNGNNRASPMSTPMAFWTEQDVLQYIKNRNLAYASVYGDIVADACGQLRTTREQRTGCMFCMFGVHREKAPNRFQRMAVSHPKQWSYCMDKLGIGAVLDYIGVPCKPAAPAGKGE